jgi:hypothetical protein
MIKNYVRQELICTFLIFNITILLFSELLEISPKGPLNYKKELFLSCLHPYTLSPMSLFLNYFYLLLSSHTPFTSLSTCVDNEMYQRAA